MSSKSIEFLPIEAAAAAFGRRVAGSPGQASAGFGRASRADVEAVVAEAERESADAAAWLEARTAVEGCDPRYGAADAEFPFDFAIETPGPDHLAAAIEAIAVPEVVQNSDHGTHLPTDSEARKGVPVATGVVDYFPDALIAVAELSKIGNDKHNPGEPLHWARGKSDDHPDCLLRHFIERGTIDTDGVRHSVKVAWRALALLQLELEAAKGGAK